MCHLLYICLPIYIWVSCSPELTFRLKALGRNPAIFVTFNMLAAREICNDIEGNIEPYWRYIPLRETRVYFFWSIANFRDGFSLSFC